MEPTLLGVASQTATQVVFDKTTIDTALTAAGYTYTPTANDSHEKIVVALVLYFATQMTKAIFDSNVAASLFWEFGTIARTTTKSGVTDSPLFKLEQVTVNFSTTGIHPDQY